MCIRDRNSVKPTAKAASAGSHSMPNTPSAMPAQSRTQNRSWGNSRSVSSAPQARKAAM